jgi:hypothetical protein
LGYDRRVAEAPADLRGHATAATILALLALVVYGQLLAPHRVPFSPYSDLLTTHLATKSVLHDAVASRSVPFWRRDQMLGAPALTDPQALYLHPLQALFFFLPPLRAFGPTIVLELLCAALGCYALARAFGCGLWAALLAGIAELMCFKLVIAAYAGWSSVLAPLCLLPALAAALVRLAHRPSFDRTLLLAGCLAAALSGASPQTLYYLLLIFAPYLGLAAVMRNRPHALTHALRAAACALAALLFALACTAYLWTPLTLELPLLARGEQSYAFFFSGHALGLEHLATWLHPELLGTPLTRSYVRVELWEDVAYFGIVPFVGTLVAFGRFHLLRAEQRFLVLAFALSALLSLRSPVLDAAFHYLPGYSVFRFPGRMLFVTAVVGITLAAVMLQDLIDRATRRRALATVVVLALAMVIEGRVYSARYLSVVDEAPLRVPESHPARGLGGATQGRLAVVGRSAFNYGWAYSAGVRLLNGYNPYSFAHYKHFMDLAAEGHWRDVELTNWFDLQQVARPDLLREAAVQYLVSRTPLDFPGLEPLGARDGVRSFSFYRGFSSKRLFTYRLIEPRPWARFADRVELVDSLTAMADRIQREPLSGQAYVLRSAAGAASRELIAGEQPHSMLDGRVHIEREEAGRAVLSTERPQAGLLVIAEAWHPGWRARLDGNDVRPVQTNLSLIGVFMPGGTHRIELHFEPLGWSVAARVSIVAWLFLLGLGARRLWSFTTRAAA